MQRLTDCHYFTKVIHKSTYDAFQGTELQDELISRNINTVVVTGTMTNLCCETTARSAFCKNFDVLFVGDATSTCSDEMHHSSLINLSFGFARVVGTRQLLKQLANIKK
jgi:isochorismate hydrolase